jgi:hypothetical protein
MWIYNNEPLIDIPEGFIGFVYLIENLSNGKKYIGKKLFRFTRTRRVKGRKQKKMLDSGWKTYYGSNKLLREDVLTQGEKHFRRTILHLCRTRGEASYLEAKEIFLRDAILSNTFYNEWISVKVARNHLPK